MRDRHQNFPLVLVTTDSMDSAARIAAVLSQHKLDNVESWAFSTVKIQQLRYTIDPAWYGEIPRSYFYDAGHHRVGVSGALKAGQIEKWLRPPHKDPL